MKVGELSSLLHELPQDMDVLLSPTPLTHERNNVVRRIGCVRVAQIKALDVAANRSGSMAGFVVEDSVHTIEEPVPADEKPEETRLRRLVLFTLSP